MRILILIVLIGAFLPSCKKKEDANITPTSTIDTITISVDSLQATYFLYAGNIIHERNGAFESSFSGVVSTTYNYRSNKIAFNDTMKGRYFTYEYDISKKQNDSEIYYRAIIVRDSLIAWYYHSNSDGSIAYTFRGKKTITY